jgi:uncharacterized membrane protein
MPANIWTWISAAVAIALAIVIIVFALVVAWKLLKGDINLTYLLAEPADPTAVRPQGEPPETPKASISRFQFLIFTFVIAGVYLVLCLESGRFVDIPENVILLLGVSGTSYAASKGIKAAADTSQRNAIVTGTGTGTGTGTSTGTAGSGGGAAGTGTGGGGGNG